MPLPQDGVKWPPDTSIGPTRWEEVYTKYAEWGAWYSGDGNQIALVHSHMVNTATPKGRMWAKDLYEERRVQLHVPLPGDIARASADLLFSETPKFKIPEAHQESAPADAVAAQTRLSEIVEQGAMHNRLLEAAEACAAMSGVFIKVNWDQGLLGVPVLSVAQADMAIPEFRLGILSAVTLWRVIEEDGHVIWRHLERHELEGGNGVILNALYRGTDDSLGFMVPIDTRADTAYLVGQERIAPGIKGLLVRYVPNTRPNRLWRGTPLGQSDFSGVEGLFDALDEVYTSLVRDIRLAQSRIIVPEFYLGKDAQGKSRFDIDQEVFAALDIDPLSAEKTGITMTNFSIRSEEHIKACVELSERIVSMAGYSPQSFNFKGDGGAKTATEIKANERKSFITRGKKERYWRQAVEEMVYVMMQIDRWVFGGKAGDFRPSVELSDSIQNDIGETSATIELLSRAGAASVKTKVMMAHPEWSIEEIDGEVEAILKETGALVPSPDEMDLP